jgi:hypothetical protein
MHFELHNDNYRLVHRGESIARIVRSHGEFWTILFCDGRSSEPLPLAEAQSNAKRFGLQTWLKDAPTPPLTPLQREAHERNIEVRAYTSAPDDKGWADFEPRRRR